MGKCKVFMLSLCRQTDQRADRRTMVNNMPDLSIQGHKKKSVCFYSRCTPLYPKMQSYTRCVCETLIPPKHPSFEKHDRDI